MKFIFIFLIISSIFADECSTLKVGLQNNQERLYLIQGKSPLIQDLSKNDYLCKIYHNQLATPNHYLLFTCIKGANPFSEELVFLVTCNESIKRTLEQNIKSVFITSKFKPNLNLKYKIYNHRLVKIYIPNYNNAQYIKEIPITFDNVPLNYIAVMRILADFKFKPKLGEEASIPKDKSLFPNSFQLMSSPYLFCNLDYLRTEISDDLFTTIFLPDLRNYHFCHNTDFYHSFLDDLYKIFDNLTIKLTSDEYSSLTLEEKVYILTNAIYKLVNFYNSEYKKEINQYLLTKEIKIPYSITMNDKIFLLETSIDDYIKKIIIQGFKYKKSNKKYSVYYIKVRFDNNEIYNYSCTSYSLNMYLFFHCDPLNHKYQTLYFAARELPFPLSYILENNNFYVFDKENNIETTYKLISKMVYNKEDRVFDFIRIPFTVSFNTQLRENEFNAITPYFYPSVIYGETHDFLKQNESDPSLNILYIMLSPYRLCGIIYNKFAHDSSDVTYLPKTNDYLFCRNHKFYQLFLSDITFRFQEFMDYIKSFKPSDSFPSTSESQQLMYLFLDYEIIYYLKLGIYKLVNLYNYVYLSSQGRVSDFDPIQIFHEDHENSEEINYFFDKNLEELMINKKFNSIVKEFILYKKAHKHKMDNHNELITPLKPKSPKKPRLESEEIDIES